ncbi:hypothetical protein SAMN05445756_0407 [Kytococcus aerolatus]|uniref:Transcriptional regulator, AbiEi antitoxin, Type IV TA system n=1 Tax=Kytococcus aerolatus TaxID=592308 RepID=A0A212T4X8_9MICO|nr:hypothetical protein [Kytococcus aerolatus]SNC61069.1 hypothetical protein SAMN05445756_0407 [Kytococcus aerolatus]
MDIPPRLFSRGVVWRDDLARLSTIRAHGITDAAVHRAIARGAAWRPAPGVLAAGPPPARAAERHLLRTTAHLLKRPGHCATATSALVLHGLPVLGDDEPVHLGAPHHRDRRRAMGPVVLHRHQEEPEVVTPPGCTSPWPVTHLTRALVRHAMEPGRHLPWAVVPWDAALHAGMVTRTEIAAELTTGLKGVGTARAALALVDPACESPGETLTRVPLVLAGLRPRSQVVLRTRRGEFRVDLLLEDEGVIVEFDGVVKYGSAGGREALVLEKDREDALRELGYTVVRVRWHDVVSEQGRKQLVQRVRQAATGPWRSGRLPG